MGCVAVKFNFFAHSMAQGKKQGSQAPDVNPAARTNIQNAVIQTYSGKGKDVVRLHAAFWCCARAQSLVLDLGYPGSR